ncbi:maleylacetoacetate isomerase [Roseibium polysiphoniae]|uniref:maleylacetoacetate isomerase n=1 Tax=Roseibium polysiphoniae TaxID=2571221 RepID=UPI003297EE7D
MTRPRLHSYFRSSTSYRLRIALNLKGVETDYIAHHLRTGAQRFESYLKLNPQGLVPSLELPDESVVLIQSLPIIEYLEETIPEPPLLPADPIGRARVRALAQMIACEIHPVNNLRVLNKLRQSFGADDDAVADWFRHWVAETFGPLEALLFGSPDTRTFCHGDNPGLADICLVAQVANNQRFQVDMSPYPTIRRIYDASMARNEFQQAAPVNQPDAE